MTMEQMDIQFSRNRKRVLYEQKSPQFVHLVNSNSDIDILSLLVQILNCFIH